MESALQHIRHRLNGSFIPSEASFLARLILREAGGISDVDMTGCKFSDLSDAVVQKIEKIVSRLLNHEPYQYILGKTEFYGLPFHVTPDVLIPRPETEELVEWVLSENSLPRLRILDVGTGSGCIAVTLAKKNSTAEVQAWDVSEKALEVARHNAALNAVDVQFVRKNVLLSLDEAVIFDVIVSNPPYVLESEKGTMEQNVLAHEPHLALFVPNDDPLLFYERIADLAAAKLSPGGKLYFEINRSKGAEIAKMLSQIGFENIELRKDISGNERMVRAQKTKNHEQTR